jgi:hypothetical protein
MILINTLASPERGEAYIPSLNHPSINMTGTLWVALGVLVVVLLGKGIKDSRRGPKLPPGPAGLLLLGKTSHLKYRDGNYTNLLCWQEMHISFYYRNPISSLTPSSK